MSMEGVKGASERMDVMREPLSDVETDAATELVRGSIFVEVPGVYNPEKPDPTPKPLTNPELRTLSDYITSPCKHECNIFKQIRHAKQAHRVLSALNPIKQTLLRATAGECGLDSAHCHFATVRDVAKLDRPRGGSQGEGSRETTLFRAATLHRYGQPVDFARLAAETLPEICACCKAPFWDPAI